MKTIVLDHKNIGEFYNKIKMSYMKPDGSMINEKEAKKLIKEGKYQIKQPSYQGSSIEEEQVGIKHY